MSSVAASSLVTFLVNAVWQIALIAGAGWLAARMLRRLGPQAEHVAWVCTLIAAILAPVSQLAERLLPLLPQSAGPHFGNAALEISKSAITGMRGVYAIPPQIFWFVLVLYLGSILYFYVRLVRALYSAAALLREASCTALTSEENKLFMQCKRAFSLNTVRILNSSQIVSPVAMGVSRVSLILPAGFAGQCTPRDLLVALAHECAHINRRDYKKNLFYEIASLIVDFHPAIWFIKAQIAQTREMVCDAMVTEKLVDARSYAHSLMRLAAIVANVPRVSVSSAIGIFDANILEKRIMWINLKKQCVSPLLKYGLAIPAAVLLLAAVTTAAAMAVTIENQAPSGAVTQASPYGQVYKISKDVSAPVPLNTVVAEFPKSALKIKAPVDTIVIVKLVVDASGVPRDVHVTPADKPDFDTQAVKAVERYRFTPAKRAGVPVAVALSVEVNFKKY